MPTAKQITFNILDELKPNDIIGGFELAIRVHKQTGKVGFAATYIRYLRIYREKTGKKIVNFNKAKSLYRYLIE